MYKLHCIDCVSTVELPYRIWAFWWWVRHALLGCHQVVVYDFPTSVQKEILRAYQTCYVDKHDYVELTKALETLEVQRRIYPL